MVRSIDIKKIKEATNRILDQLLADGIETIPLSNQMYLAVSSTEKYDMDNVPEQLVVGDLFDDLEFSESILQSDERAAVYSLTEISPLLAYVGEVVAN